MRYSARLRRHRGGTDDSGAALVEFALVMIPLLVIVFGIVNFGIVFSHQLALNNAVREGARKAVVNEPGDNRTCQGIADNVRSEAAAPAFDSGAIKVQTTADGFTSDEPCPTGFVDDPQGDNVPCLGSYDDTTKKSGSLVVQAKYDSVLLVTFPPFPQKIGLSAKAVYRCEFSGP